MRHGFSRSIPVSALLAVLVLGTLPAAFAQEPPLPWNTFPSITTIGHTMAVGGVTATSARFRVQSATANSINVELTTDTVSGTSMFGTAVKADTARYNTVLIGVNGLRPDHRYFYRAWIGGVPQPGVQSFRTFPEPGTNATFTFAFGSCQQSGTFLPSSSQGNVFRAVARSGASLFLQLGDWGYPDTVDNPPANNNFFSADYRLVQESYLTKFDPAYPMSAVLETMPVDYVYDDHDFMNNNSSATTSSFFIPSKPNALGPEYAIMEIPNPAGARENSIRGYKDNMPTYPLVNETRGIYHKFTSGDAEFFMLDLRSQRSPNLEPFQFNATTGKWDYNIPVGHSILAAPTAPGSGESQLTWLLDGLRTSRAKWKFLISTVPFNKAQSIAITIGLIFQDSLAPPQYGLPHGTAGIGAALEFSDKWVGFPADVDTLLNTIRQNNISNVIVLSGDSHTAAMDDGTNAGLPEIMAGCLDIKNSEEVAGFEALGIHIWNRGGQGITTSLFNNAFGKVTVHGADSVTLQLVDENGTVFASQTIKDATTGVRSEELIPGGFGLAQNYPNPFNPVTTIKYTVGGAGGKWQVASEAGAGEAGAGIQVPGARKTRLLIYDVLGRQVATLVDGEQAPGTYEVRFDGSGLASGVYIYRFASGSFVQSRTMLLLK